MERDFMGLSSMTLKDEDNNDSGYAKGCTAQWPFPSKVSALPHFASFKFGQEDNNNKMRKNISSEPQVSSAFGPFLSSDPFDHNRAVLELKRSLNHEKQQGGAHYSMTAYPVHSDLYTQYAHNAKIFSNTNQQAIMKHQYLGGIPVAPQNTVRPNLCSIAGISDQWNNTNKPSGSPAQMTIFYAGTVNVYDTISPEKAQAIMFLAGNSSSLALASNVTIPKSQPITPTSKFAAIDGIPVNQPLNTPSSALSSPSSVSSHSGTHSGSGSTNTDDIMAAKTAGAPNTPMSNVEPPMKPATAMLRSPVPQARKASLARFLEKRKERMMNLAPYNLCKSSSECTAAESNGANFSASPATESFLH